MIKNIKAVIHCSDSPDGRGDDAESIHRWHQEAPNYYDGIGYHYVILENGEVQKGRPDFWTGAHAKGYNEALGICLIGEDDFTYKQFQSLDNLLSKLGLKDDEIVGHNEISIKSCPNFDVKKWLELRDLIKVNE